MIDFEKAHVSAAMRLVVGNRFELTRKQRGAQDRLLGNQRVGQSHPIVGEARFQQVSRRQERHREGFVTSTSEENLPDQPTTDLEVAETSGQFSPGYGSDDVLVAVQACHLFSYVSFGFGVPAPGGNRDSQVLCATIRHNNIGTKTDGRQILRHFGRTQVSAE